MTISPFTKHFGARCVLDFPGAQLQTGAVCAVVGANGSGKSTLARCAAGVLAADQRGAVTDAQRPGFLPQRSYPFHMSVLQNLLLNAAPGDAARARAAALLQQLEIEHLAGESAPLLSGGECARMALARLLMRRYDLLILDEPTAAMDIRSTLLAEALVADYCRETGCAVLWITHALAQARRTAQRVLFLADGRLAEAGAAAQLLSAPETPALRQFLDFSTL